MQYILLEEAAETVEVDVLFIPVTRAQVEARQAPQLEAIHALLGFDVLKAALSEGFKGRAGSRWSTHTHGKLRATRLALLGVGDDDAQEAAAHAGRHARSLGAKTIAHGVLDLQDISSVVAGFDQGVYKFDRYLTSKPDATSANPETLYVLASLSAQPALEDAISLAEAVRTARDLVNGTPLDLTPAGMAARAQELADAHGFDATIFDEVALEAQGFNLIMAVGKGSQNPPRLIHLVYRPDGDVTRKVAFVGKGVTFDTGGYNIKTGGHMMNMHCDMGGGAAVLGAADAIGRLRPEGVEVHFIVPSADNSIDGNAMRPNDIYRGYGDQTVEIHNTDAEGRLILADALAYAQEQGVDTIVDLATLTGACVVALGEHTAALFSDDEDLAARLLAAATDADEDLWRMPLTKRLDRQLDSPVADMKNIGKRMGGAITAALFLKRWVKIDGWAHMDIAGPAFTEGGSDAAAHGGTGYAVATLTHFVQSLSEGSS